MTSSDNSSTAPYYYGELLGSSSPPKRTPLPSRQLLLNHQSTSPTSSSSSTSGGKTTIILPSSCISLHHHEPMISPIGGGSSGSGGIVNDKFRTGILLNNHLAGGSRGGQQSTTIIQSNTNNNSNTFIAGNRNGNTNNNTSPKNGNRDYSASSASNNINTNTANNSPSPLVSSVVSSCPASYSLTGTRTPVAASVESSSSSVYESPKEQQKQQQQHQQLQQQHHQLGKEQHHYSKNSFLVSNVDSDDQSSTLVNPNHHHPHHHLSSRHSPIALQSASLVAATTITTTTTTSSTSSASASSSSPSSSPAAAVLSNNKQSPIAAQSVVSVDSSGNNITSFAHHTIDNNIDNSNSSNHYSGGNSFRKSVYNCDPYDDYPDATSTGYDSYQQNIPRDESQYGIVSSTILNLEKQLREYEEKAAAAAASTSSSVNTNNHFDNNNILLASSPLKSNQYYRPVYHPGSAARFREDDDSLIYHRNGISNTAVLCNPANNNNNSTSSSSSRSIPSQAKKLLSSTLLRSKASSTASSNNNSSSNNNNNASNSSNSPSPTSRIYQRSLSIFVSGVSPLLRKKNKHAKPTTYTIQPGEQKKSQDSPPSPPEDNDNEQSESTDIESNTLGSRRKSEPIMFSYDSMTSEISKFQAREEKIVENINLDLEKMLMNDANSTVGPSAMSNGQHHQQQQQQQLQQQQQQQLQQQQEAQYMTNAQIKSTMLQMGDGPPAGSVMRQYKMPPPQHQHQASSSSSNSYYVSGRKLPDGTPAGQAFGARTMHSTPQIGANPALSYKDPFYLVYDDNRRPMGASSHHTLHHTPGAHNDDNIYEEIDFLTLSNLRATYADTLSLNGYKQAKSNNSKSGSKRSLASSSFTRWFSTRKKNSPSLSEDESPYLDIKLSKKQRPPISLPPPPQNLTEEQLKRRYVVGTIVESENSYINSLQWIINCYKKPLEEASSTILSQNKINIIFHRLEQILQCHTIFGIALSQCVREWDEKEQIGDVFIASFSKSMVLDIYSDFINNFTNAMETARKAAKSKSAFGAFLQEKNLSSPDRLSFFGYMVKPVQRFPQFILLLSDLLKRTPADHVDRMSLQLALTQLESLADRLNERKRDAERHFAVKQLLKDYLSPSTTNSSHRFLLRQDDVYQLDLDTGSGLVMKTKCRKLYLLNDMLVCVSVPANRLKFAVALTDVDVMEDVAPATNNLMANSMLKKDPTSNSASPKHFTVERMYCDLNGLLHDNEVITRIANLISSLRYTYQGLSIEGVQAIGAEIREEMRKKDAQITLIDRSCLQIRIRSKNYKDIICIQMNDPEIKKDWLTDVRLAKLALDRANNPAWDIVNESLSASRANLSNTIIMHRVPLFVRSLPIFATTDNSKLTCALHYRLARRDDIVFEQNSGVLWICNVNESGSQLGALETNGSDISLIHSYELCDSHVTCIESVGTYAVWIGLRQGRIIVIDASSPGEWQQFASLEVPSVVTCIKHLGAFVYVGLQNGDLRLFNATHYEEPIVITLSQGFPITCLLPVNREMFACCADKIWIIKGSTLNRHYSLSNPDSMVSSPSGELGSPNGPEIKPIHPQMVDDGCRPNLLAHCGIGLWVSIDRSPIIKLYHTETFKHLQDVNVCSNIKRTLRDSIDPMNIYVTSMLATRGLLWVGTNVGVVVTLNLPRLQGVPLISGCLNVALHRHTGPVTILLSLTSANAPMQNVNAELQAQLQSQTPASSTGSETDQAAAKAAAEQNNQALELSSRQDDLESIYGLYSDLLNVENYVRPGEDSRQGLNSNSASAMGKMTWDLAQLQLGSDGDSNTESIYQDGGILRRKQAATMPRKMMEYAPHPVSMQHPGNMAISPAKSQNSIYDTNMISAAASEKSGGHAGDLQNAPASLAQSQSIYDIAPYRGAPQKPVDPGRTYDSNNNSTATKTALLLTGGNGYKRVTFGDAPYSSQHAHCCIWEYKL